MAHFYGASVRVAEVVRYVRMQKNISARALAAKAGLSPSYVSKLEAGEIEPSLRAFGKIVSVLELTPYEVFVCVVQEGRHESPVSLEESP